MCEDFAVDTYSKYRIKSKTRGLKKEGTFLRGFVVRESSTKNLIYLHNKGSNKI